MPAIYVATMSSREAGGRAPGRRASELRRYSREVRPWSVVLETRDGLLTLPLIDLSPGGAKVRLTEPLKEGTNGRLYFLPPHWRPRAVEVIVWRIDTDGVVLRFNSPNIAPLPAARDVRLPDSWLWAWEAQPPASAP
jgi:PilZ domain-containing protein